MEQKAVDDAIARLREADRMSRKLYRGQPLIVTYSGGKDSSVILELAKRSGIEFQVQHSHTTADAPETVYFIREQFRKLEADGVQVEIEYPTEKGQPTSMWKLIPERLVPPTRLMRYCCSVLKETGGVRRFIATGVRWAESSRRKNSRGIYETAQRRKNNRIILNNDNNESRALFETCQLKAKRVVNPIIDWTDRDVWEFIESEHIEVNPLYCEGFDRVGCIGCPMAAKKRYKEFKRWPKYKELYLRAFARMLERRKQAGKFPPDDPTGWKTPEEVFSWWMEEKPILEGQISMEEIMEDEE